MNTEITLLILAAGKGSRYGGNKQFDSIGYSGEYLFEYSIFDAIQAGFKRIVIVTSNDFKSKLEDYLRSKIPSEISIKCVAQNTDTVPTQSIIPIIRTKPWGTAHALWSASSEIEGPFVTINADDYYGKEALTSAFDIASSLSSEHLYGMISYLLKNTLSNNGTVSRGICKFLGKQLSRIEEFTQLSEKGGVITDRKSEKHFSGHELVSMNLWILTPEVFKAIETQFELFIQQSENIQEEEVYLPSVIQSQIDGDEITVDVETSQSQWMGMTYASDKLVVMNRLNEYVQAGLYPPNLWKNQ